MSPKVNQQFERLMRKSAFNPIRRHVTGADPDDRLSEGIGQVYELALRKSARGEQMDDALVVYAARLRALDIRRQLVKGGQPRRDAMHPANYTDGRTEVLRLDGCEDETDGRPGEGDVGLQAAWLAATSIDPGEELAAAVDLDTWLAGLGASDRELLAGRLAGFSLQEIAERTDHSITTVFKRLRQLGVDLAERAGIVLVRKKRRPRRRAPSVAAAAC